MDKDDFTHESKHCEKCFHRRRKCLSISTCLWKQGNKHMFHVIPVGLGLCGHLRPLHNLILVVQWTEAESQQSLGNHSVTALGIEKETGKSVGYHGGNIPSESVGSCVPYLVHRQESKCAFSSVQHYEIWLLLSRNISENIGGTFFYLKETLTSVLTNYQRQQLPP